MRCLVLLLLVAMHAQANNKVVETVIIRARPPREAPLSRSTINAEAIAKQPPTANAFELLRLAAGANVATSDPYGLSPSTNISVRGLNGDEIAYLVEGAPLNDIGYYAGYPSQWADSENLQSVSLQQGTVDLDTPTVNAGGGLVSLTLQDPQDKPGGRMAVSYGSYHADREFIRLDTGTIANSNLRGFVSFSNTDADNYRGAGRDHRQHIDAKATDTWGDGNRIAIAGSYHDAILSGYPMPTLQAWDAAGRSNNYDSAFCAGDTNYWKLYQQSWHDVQISAPSHFTLTDRLAFETTPYFEHGFGNSPYGALLPTTGLYLGVQPIPRPVAIPGAHSGNALVLADYIGNQYRAGVTDELIATLGAHRVVAGWWYDYADDFDPQPYTPVSANGEPASIWGADQIKLPDGRTLAAGAPHTREQANVLFLGDTITLADGSLKLDAGIKYAMVTRHGTNSLPGPQYRVGQSSAQPLPRAAIRYQATPHSQVFLSISTNFRSSSEYVLYDTYDVLSGNRLTQGSRQRDEYSISEEAGLQYQGRWLAASVTAFNYNFTNRQVSTLTSSMVGTSINAGGQTSRGVDVELTGVRIRGWRPLLSAEYLHATIDRNFATGGDYLATAGKTAVRSPAFQGAAALDYANDTLSGSISIKYTGSQYATFNNDQRIPSHVQADAMLGLNLPATAYVKKPELRLNLVNLTDEKFLSGIATVTPTARGATGAHGTPIAGAAPTYYIGTGFAAILTLAAAF